jgi:hypothetical protein
VTKQDFIQYLSAPEKLNGNTIATLEKLVLEYPYFQTGRMLYLKNLHNNNNIDYEKNLGITAAYAPNGKVLYNLIRKKPQAPHINSTQETIHEVNLCAGQVPSPKSQAPSPAPQLETQTESTQYTAGNKQSETRIQTSKKILPRIEPVVVLQEIPVAPSKSSKPLLNPLCQLTEGLALPSPSLMGRVGAGLSYSFNDWLKIVSGKSLQEIKTEKPGAFGSIQQGRTNEKKQKSEIIERFILEETAKPVSKPKVEFYSAEAVAKKSLQDDETFVTETLAKIYLQQGHLQKAFKAYQILMVKHPEKIHIFASISEKIKKLMEQQKAK